MLPAAFQIGKHSENEPRWHTHPASNPIVSNEQTPDV
jgi:hypothetical protein